MGILDFVKRGKSPDDAADSRLAEILEGFSIEVMPRTAAKVPSFPELLPPGTRVYIAHIDGTPIDAMVATARRLHDDGFEAMPHFPARSIKDHAMLENWIRRYREEAGVEQALVLGGGLAAPRGAFDSAAQLLETGLFEKFGYRRLHVAGHPEGNKDIDTDGSTRLVDDAIDWKQAYSERTDAEMAIVTQFAFDARPTVQWAERLQSRGVTLPIHLGVAGPAKLQTLIKFALSCGVGPSIQVLRKRTMDMTKLVIPYTPTEVLSGVAGHLAHHLDSLIKQVHIFPLGGIAVAAQWAEDQQAQTVDTARCA